MNYETLVRYFAGESSPKEAEQVSLWKQGNEETYQQLHRQWNLADEAFVYPEFNTQAAWHKVSSKLGLQETKIVPFYQRKWAIAASVAVFLLAGVWALFTVNNQSNEAIVFKKITNQSQENKNITLADGSTVILRKGATLHYTEQFEGKERLVKLDGQGFFQVAKNPNQPFVIEAGNGRVQVVGTAFGLKATTQATEVVVTEGTVNFGNESANNQPLILTKNKKGVLSSTGKIEEKPFDPNDISWQTGVLVFDETPLEEAIKIISEQYGTPITLKLNDPKLAGRCKLSITFSKVSLQQVFQELSILLSLEYRRLHNGSVEITSVVVAPE